MWLCLPISLSSNLLQSSRREPVSSTKPGSCLCPGYNYEVMSPSDGHPPGTPSLMSFSQASTRMLAWKQVAEQTVWKVTSALALTLGLGSNHSYIPSWGRLFPTLCSLRFYCDGASMDKVLGGLGFKTWLFYFMTGVLCVSKSLHIYVSCV